MRNIAWAAGIFEGEGSITIRTLRPHNRERHPAVIMQMNMTDEDVVREFFRIVEVGTLRGPYHSPSRGSKRKPIWFWSAAGKDVKPLLQQFLPYLLSRRTVRALEAIQAVDNMYPDKKPSICLYCDKEVRARGLCKFHYQRWYNNCPIEPSMIVVF